MPRTRSIVLALALTGCGDAGERVGSHPLATASATTALAPSAPTAATSAPPPVASAAPPPKSSLAWEWRGPALASNDGRYTKPIEIATKAGNCRYSQLQASGSISTECFAKNVAPRVWGYDEAHPTHDDAALAVDDTQLYVARFSDIASGCEVVAYALDSGEVRWRTHLVGLGPIAHSQYLNRVELRVDKSKVRIFGWEISGKYIEELDVGSGKTVTNVRVDDAGQVTAGLSVLQGATPAVERPGAASGIAFRFAGPTPPKLPDKNLTVQSGATTCVYAFERDGDRIHFACNDAKSNRLWGIDLATQFVASAALVADSKNVYVASFCGIATGTTLTAYESVTGHELWRVNLFGVGPVSHSKYSNEVSLRLEGSNVVVSGWESAGKYVEVVDATTGADRGNRSER